MIRFNNDYSMGAHPEIIKALAEVNEKSFGGYGIDEWCSVAADEIKKYLSCDCDIHFLVGGTQTNLTVISSALRSFQSVLCADTGHINVHETGAIENTGHKVHALASCDGKITAEQIEYEAQLYLDSDIKEHITQPKMVYLSFSTEYGTLYTKDELFKISEVCKKFGLYLFIDGARLGYGLGAPENDVTLSDIAKACDVFYIGGTKCGAMFGEAVVIVNPMLKADFRSYIKQNGAMLAKGWLLGVQFHTLFKDGLYFEITKNAVLQAIRIKEAFLKKGIKPYIDSPTNQQFVTVSDEIMNKLSEKYVFEYDLKLEDGKNVIRFCTGWYTKDSNVDELVADIERL